MAATAAGYAAIPDRFAAAASRYQARGTRNGVCAMNAMGQAERFEASLTEDGRYRLLVDAITDYAIYMLDPAG